MSKSYFDIISKRNDAHSLVDAKNCVGPGWSELLENIYGYISFLYNDFRIIIYVTQVKEKFGGLRVYYDIDASSQCINYDTDLIHQTILAVENLSFDVCEDCGKRGKTVKVYGWMKTLCEDCFKETVKND